MDFKKIRLNHSLSQQNIANKIGITKQMYSKIERGELNGSKKTIKKIYAYMIELEKHCPCCGKEVEKC